MVVIRVKNGGNSGATFEISALATGPKVIPVQQSHLQELNTYILSKFAETGKFTLTAYCIKPLLAALIV